MRQHGKFEKIRSKNSSYERVFRSFSGNFPEASRSIFCHPFDVFNALEVPGPSQNDPGSILDRSFFEHFFLKKLTLYVDEVASFTAPRINSFEQTQCDSKSKQLI